MPSIKDRMKAFESGGNKDSSAKEKKSKAGEKFVDGLLSPGTGGGKPKLSAAIFEDKEHCDSSGSFDFNASFNASNKYSLEKQAILEARMGSVQDIAKKFDEQVAINEAMIKKILDDRRATRSRRHKKLNKKRAPKQADTQKKKAHKKADTPKKHHSSVFKNKRGVTSFKVDPKTYKAPKKLDNPTAAQTELLEKAMKENVFIHDEDNKDLLHAFEPILVDAGSKYEELNDDHYYVVEKGQVNVHVNGVKIGTFKEGDTFGDLNLLYNNDKGKKATVLINCSDTEDTKLLRLNQADMLGILQNKSKKGNDEKKALLKSVPFMNKLLKANEAIQKNKQVEKDNWEERVYDIMREVDFKKGDVLGDEKANEDTLYMVKEGNVKITSTDNQEFVLGPGDYIGKKALMGVGGKEPTVKKLEALNGGAIYAIDNKVVDKVLGKNFFARETVKLTDVQKLREFQCMKSVDPPSLDVMTQIIAENELDAGATILKQGDQVEPSLYLVREGEVMLHTNDGKFKHTVKAGGYFGVEHLLVPKNKKETDIKLPAEWNVTVSGNGPCAVGILSLNECQAILNSGSKIPKERIEKEEKKIVDKDSAIMKKRQESQKAIVEKKITLDDLEMKSVLGDGAFGEVWLVSADVTGKKQDFALKMIKMEGNEDLKVIEREIKVTQLLQHPGIVQLVTTFRDEESIYLLMGLIQGGELWDQVHREDEYGEWESGLPESQAKFYAYGITDAFAFIHSKQHVYRDLKPENVMIDGDGYPMLVDFGFAKHCPDKTFTACGTPNYVAPEIIWNRGHNHAVDYWALGVLIYEMVCGEHPFYEDGMDQVAVFEAITGDDYAPLPDCLSENVMSLVDALLEKEASERLGMLKGKANDILEHPWFSEFDLADMRARKVKAPYVPPKKKR